LCGLIGVATNDFSQTEFEMMRTGLYLMQNRGSQGTGIGIINNRGITILKSGQSAIDFIENPGFTRALNIQGKAIVIGHTRAPVYGGAGKKCAHPFRINNTVLAHNGLLTNYQKVCYTYDIKPATKNDTEVLTMFLDKEGLKKMSEWEGTFALSFYYKNRLYLYKDADGELFLSIADCKDGKKIYIWASEWTAIKFILLQAKLDAPIYSLAPYKLWSLSLDNFPDVHIKQKHTTITRYAYKGNDVQYNKWGVAETDHDPTWIRDGDVKSCALDGKLHFCEWCGTWKGQITYVKFYNSWLCDTCHSISESDNPENIAKNWGIKTPTQAELTIEPEDGGCEK